MDIQWTVTGPTIRAIEGDVVRINFINNENKEHTMHFHGIHPAEMDGVFEPVGVMVNNLYMNLRLFCWCPPLSLSCDAS